MNARAQLSSVVFVEANNPAHQLLMRFNELQQPVDGTDILAIETQKLAIINELHELIQQKIAPYSPPARAHLPPPPVDMFSYICNQFLYYFLLTFGFFQNAVGSYLFWSSIISLIPDISDPFLVMLSVLTIALSAILFYAFEISFLKDSLGIPYTSTDLGQLIEVYSNQVKTTIAINQMLTSVYSIPMDDALYDECAQLLVGINRNLRLMQSPHHYYPESNFKTAFKIAMVAFGVLSSIANSYFTANLIMTLLSASLVGTPIGIAIIMLTIVVDLGFYHAMGRSNIASFINPDFKTYQQFEQKLEEFAQTCNDDLAHAQTIRHGFFAQKAPSEDHPSSIENASLALGAY